MNRYPIAIAALLACCCGCQPDEMPAPAATRTALPTPADTLRLMADTTWADTLRLCY